MSRVVVRSEPVIPKRLSTSERSALVDGLLEVYGEIFLGATRDYVVNGLVSPNSELTTILVHRNAEGRIVGYFAIHFFARSFRGVPTTVVRSSVGMLRAYRGRNSNIAWALRVLLEQRLAHPRRPFYGMGSMVHPSSYLQVARYVDVFWPKPGEPIPPDVLEFIVALADEFGMKRIDPQQPLVRAGSMPTRETDVERDYWRRSDKPAARFFVAMNPSYSRGNGLVTLFPITISMLVGIGSRILRDKTKLLGDGAIATAQRLPLGGRLLRPAVVRRHLRAVPLFAGLGDASLARVVGLSRVVTLPAAKTLIREGDEGDELYVVARGAVAVLVGPPASEPASEVMIDQLGSGALFGEIAVLAGGRRKATVRTVIPTTLVRIPGAMLREAMQGTALGDAIWEVFAGRIFDDHLRADGRYQALGRSGRLDWIRRAPHAVHEPGTAVPSAGTAFLVVLRGTVSIEQGTQTRDAQAPIVIELDASMRVTVVSEARIVHVPSLADPP
jgi:CRP-like cAMP-binding protein